MASEGRPPRSFFQPGGAVRATRRSGVSAAAGGSAAETRRRAPAGIHNGARPLTRTATAFLYCLCREQHCAPKKSRGCSAPARACVRSLRAPRQQRVCRPGSVRARETREEGAASPSRPRFMCAGAVHVSAAGLLGNDMGCGPRRQQAGATHFCSEPQLNPNCYHLPTLDLRHPAAGHCHWQYATCQQRRHGQRRSRKSRSPPPPLPRRRCLDA